MSKLPLGNNRINLEAGAQHVRNITQRSPYAPAMRVVAMTADHELRLVDKPEPVPGPDDVIVRVERCGICGTDLHVRLWGSAPVGAVLGHEFSGTVAAVGDGETAGLVAGDTVAVMPAFRCGRCRYCRDGRPYLCCEQASTMLGMGVNDGAF